MAERKPANFSICSGTGMVLWFLSSGRHNLVLETSLEQQDLILLKKGFSGGPSGKEFVCQHRKHDPRVQSLVGKIPRRRA